MSKQMDENMPVGELTVIKDFLPSPEMLAKRIRTERATLTLSKETLAFFRVQAEKQNVPYNALIRQALDDYVEHHR